MIKTEVVSAGVVGIDKKLMVVIGHGKDDDPELYLLPKGMQEEGETLIDTAKREYLQETGCEPPQIIKNIGQTDYKYKYQGVKVHKIVYWYTGKLEKLHPNQKKDNEFNDISYINAFLALGKLTHWSEKWILAKAIVINLFTK